jgi:hypothetical protein
MVSMPSSSPSIPTSNSDQNTQYLLYQAMLNNMKPEDRAPIEAALAAEMKRQANLKYLRDTIRKIGPTLTNGVATQNYALASPLTFTLNTALNGYVEGILVRVLLNYTLAVGTSAVYGLTAAGKLGVIDTIEVRYNKSQAKVRPFVIRQIALRGGLDEFSIPDIVQAGQQDATLQAYINTAMAVSTGANTTVLEFFLPFNLISPEDARGILPLMAGDTGIQVIVNTPQSLLGSDPVLNSLYAVSGSGHAVSAISGTVSVEPVYRDGDVYNSTNKLPFDIGAVQGTFQMQIDQTLTPLVANTVQRTKLNVMGYHYYVILLVIDAVQETACATQANITYIESAKDGIGGNTFWKYGTQTNISTNDFHFLNRMGYNQDVDPGVLFMIDAPLKNLSEDHNRNGKAYLDNTRNGWSDWRYGVQVAAIGSKGNGPRIEPHVFYVNPTGLVPVS